jgi:hypothetical protein
VERVAGDEGEAVVARVVGDPEVAPVDDARFGDAITKRAAVLSLQQELVARGEPLEEREVGVAVAADDRVAVRARVGRPVEVARPERERAAARACENEGRDPERGSGEPGDRAGVGPRPGTRVRVPGLDPLPRAPHQQLRDLGLDLDPEGSRAVADGDGGQHGGERAPHDLSPER